MLDQLPDVQLAVLRLTASRVTAPAVVGRPRSLARASSRAETRGSFSSRCPDTLRQ
jgi:hypothetical protein